MARVRVRPSSKSQSARSAVVRVGGRGGLGASLRTFTGGRAWRWTRDRAWRAQPRPTAPRPEHRCPPSRRGFSGARHPPDRGKQPMGWLAGGPGRRLAARPAPEAVALPGLLPVTASRVPSGGQRRPHRRRAARRVVARSQRDTAAWLRTPLGRARRSIPAASVRALGS